MTNIAGRIIQCRTAIPCWTQNNSGKMETAQQVLLQAIRILDGSENI